MTSSFIICSSSGSTGIIVRQSFQSHRNFFIVKMLRRAWQYDTMTMTTGINWVSFHLYQDDRTQSKGFTKQTSSDLGVMFRCVDGSALEIFTSLWLLLSVVVSLSSLVEWFVTTATGALRNIEIVVAGYSTFVVVVTCPGTRKNFGEFSIIRSSLNRNIQIVEYERWTLFDYDGMLWSSDRTSKVLQDSKYFESSRTIVSILFCVTIDQKSCITIITIFNFIINYVVVINRWKTDRKKDDIDVGLSIVLMLLAV